jgi:hypothetical protein
LHVISPAKTTTTTTIATGTAHAGRTISSRSFRRLRLGG